MKLLLSPVIRWLTSLPWADFLRIVGAAAWAGETWVKSAGMTEAEKQVVNASRAKHVREWITTRLPALSGWRMNVAIELAVAYLNRTRK